MGEDLKRYEKNNQTPEDSAPPKRHAMYYIIVNPASKSGRGRKIWASLEPVIREKQVAYQVIFSKGPGHVTRLVAKLTASDRRSPQSPPIRLVILGGDGTVNEALQGISDFSRVWLGYIPAGSSNDLARGLGLPKDPSLILNAILEDRLVRTVDVGVLAYGPGERFADGISHTAGQSFGQPDNVKTAGAASTGQDGVKTVRYFAVSGGIGFDAAVCREALASRFKNTLNKLGLGKLTYLSIALRQLIAARSVSCELYLDRAKEPVCFHRFLFTAIMVHRYEGGGFQFCPMADASDGKLDLCVVGKIPKLAILFALPTAFWGKHYIFPAIRHYAAAEITIKASAPLWVHTDGEVSRKADCITVRCLKQRLCLMM